MPKNAKNQPAHSERIGSCRVTVWANPGKSGATFFSIVPSRSYRPDQNKDKWEESHAFGVADLPVIQTLLSRSLDWVLTQQEDERAD